MQKIRKILRAVSEKTVLPTNQPTNNFMQKIRKILRAVSEKTVLPSNQPIITNNTYLIGPRWRRSKKLFKIVREISLHT